MELHYFKSTINRHSRKHSPSDVKIMGGGKSLPSEQQDSKDSGPKPL